MKQDGRRLIQRAREIAASANGGPVQAVHILIAAVDLAPERLEALLGTAALKPRITGEQLSTAQRAAVSRNLRDIVISLGKDRGAIGSEALLRECLASGRLPFEPLIGTEANSALRAKILLPGFTHDERKALIKLRGRYAEGLPDAR